MKWFSDIWNRLSRNESTELSPMTAFRAEVGRPKPLQQTQLHISGGTVLKVVLFIGFGYLLLQGIQQVQSILISFLVTGFFALGLTPVLTKMERFLPRWMAILVLYIVVLGIFGLAIGLVLPLLAEQLYALSQQVNGLINDQSKVLSELEAWLGTMGIESVSIKGLAAENADTISNYLSGLAGSTIGLVTGAFSSLFDVGFALVLLFFLLLEREETWSFIWNLLPEHTKAFINEHASEVQVKISEWFGGQLLLMLSVGVMTWVGLMVANYFVPIENIAVISILAGFLELFPYIGVSLTTLFAVLITISLGWPAVLAVLIVLMIVQVLEGNVLVPYIMKQTTGVSAVGVIIALSFGAILGSALGGTGLSVLFMIISIPIAAAISLYLKPDPVTTAQEE